MKFVRARPTENFPIYRMVSTGGKWELGYRQMFYGRRVSVGPNGACYIDLDYCAGASELWQARLLVTVRCILTTVPETISSGELCEMFPMARIKPMINDPLCWSRLRVLAQASRRASD